MSEFFARIWNAFSTLEPRERLLVGIAGGVAVVMLLVFGLAMPLMAATRNSERRAEAAQTEVVAVRTLRDQFDAVNGRLGAVEERIQGAPQGEIFTTLEQLAKESQVRVDAMEPRSAPASEGYRETKVQLTLKGQTLAQVVRYLHRIESAEQPLSIKSLRIRTRADKPELLDVTFTVSSFEPLTG